MLPLEIFSHQWKSFIRNEKWRRNFLITLLFTIMVVYVFAMFILLGLNIDKFFAVSGKNPIDEFNSILLWYISVDLFLRYLWQPLPTIDVLPYLRTNVHRSQIINYMLLKSYWNIFNLLPWLVVIPFALKVLLPNYGIALTLSYLIGFFAIVFFNNYLAVLIGFLSQKKGIYLVIPVSLIAFVGVCWKTSYPLGDLSIMFGSFLMQFNPLVYLLLVSADVLLIIIIRHILLNNFYVDDISRKKGRFVLPAIEFGKLKFSGEVGRYLLLEMSLLFRNKRTRQAFIMLPVLIPYFMFIGFNENDPFMSVAMVSFFMSIGAAVYGQFIFSWESSYFDGLMARKCNFVGYVKAKYYLMISLSLIISIPVTFVLARFVKIDYFLFLSFLFFSLGVVCFIILFFGTYNSGRIDLNKSQFFNYQGVRGGNMILSFVILLIPVGLYSLFKYLVNDTAGKLAIAVPGLLFIAFHNSWIKSIIAPRFMARKYRNLEGYRKLTS